MNLLKKIFLFLWTLVKLKAISKKHKSILLVAEYGEYGGTRTYFISLLHFLKKQGYEVTILDNLNLRDKEIDQLVEGLSFKWHSVNFDFWGINFKERPLGVSINSMSQQLLYELLFFATLLLKGRYSDLIFTVAYPGKHLHTIVFPVNILYILHTPVTVYGDKFTRLWVRCFLSKRRQIVTVSKSALNNIYKFWFDGKIVKHVHFVYNYYSPKFNKDSHSLTAISLTVLTIGSLEVYKNPFYFIEVAQQILAKLPKVKFIWAGDGSLMDECKKRVNNIPNVHFVGNVNNVEFLYHQATVYFQPSLIESHGIATIGALYHGIPCVVSNNGGLKESVDNGVNGYVDEIDDALKTADRILILLNQPQLCHKMGTLGKSFYNERFTKEKWQKSMKELLTINV
jgi:glycosyltransferase involved in cell wall biosynthesis